MGTALFNIFMNDLDKRVENELTCANNTKLGRVESTLMERIRTQNYDKLEK